MSLFLIIGLAFFISLEFDEIFVFILFSFFDNKFIGSILLQACLNFCSISFLLLANLSFLAVLCSNSEANSFIILSLFTI